MRRILVGMAAVGAVIAASLLLWEVSQAVLLVYAAILFALLLDSLARLAQHLAGMPRAAALAFVAVLLAGALGAFGWLAGPQAADQIAQLSERLRAKNSLGAARSRRHEPSVEGVLLGYLGVLLATPMAVAFIVLTQILYLQGALDRSEHVLGHHDQNRVAARE